ncbi:MAG TPA: polysaccharide deacetylase family protein [Chitinophagaceae bacterium]|nr:polysaccharide deacetylase family protein [Chitinophagaceae bacterium]
MKMIFGFLLTNFILMNAAVSQTGNVWNGKKCAVVLTYDDAIPQQLDNAIPTLDSLKLKATFYITAYFSRGRLNDWKKVAAKGYELGNHTLFHPCDGGPGREWVKPEYDLEKYTVQRMVDEIRMTNVFLHELDGKTKRTFAYTCGDTKIHDTSFIDLMKDDFVAVRGVRSEMHTIDKVDLYNTDCYMVNNNTADQIIEWVKKAEETNSLLIILFHGVGGGNSLNVAVPEHSKFLHYLKQNEKDIWIPTMMEAAEYVKKYQSEKNKMQ